MKMVKKVEILMSTYNGEKYVEEQINSILDQNHVYTHITVRDDGSKDNTWIILKKKQEQYPKRINLIRGHNIGYRKSFLSLLQAAQTADYYGFSDQDDVWHPEKIIKAIQRINDYNFPVLYASGVEITDDYLNTIGFNDVANMPNHIESYFTRARIPGCTFVFNHALRKITARFSDMNYSPSEMPDHDILVGSCAFLCGKVILDHSSYIKHRRHRESVTSGGNGLYKRIKTEMNIVFKRKNVRYNLAKELLTKINEDEMGKNQKAFLNEIVNYKKNLHNKLKLLSNKKMKSTFLICDLEQKIKIILNTY